MDDRQVADGQRVREVLTGLRLRLEDLARWPEAPGELVDELQVAVQQVGTLSQLVDLCIAPGEPGLAGSSADPSTPTG